MGVSKHVDLTCAFTFVLVYSYLDVYLQDVGSSVGRKDIGDTVRRCAPRSDHNCAAPAATFTVEYTLNVVKKKKKRTTNVDRFERRSQVPETCGGAAKKEKPVEMCLSIILCVYLFFFLLLNIRI